MAGTKPVAARPEPPDPEALEAASAFADLGLGLPIVRQIALSQGGLVRASNHPDGGAQLELLLPRA